MIATVVAEGLGVYFVAEPLVEEHKSCEGLNEPYSLPFSYLTISH